MLYAINMPSILVVDDNPTARMLIRTLMMNWLEAEPAEAGSYSESITYLQENDCDIVIIDMVMDPENGADLFEWIQIFNKDNGKNVRVIGITAYTDGPIANRARNLGLDTILAKPIKPDVLLDALTDNVL